MNDESIASLRQELLTAALLLTQPHLATSKRVRLAYSSPTLVNGVIHTISVEVRLERSPAESRRQS
jgi:hypothetical protein